MGTGGSLETALVKNVPEIRLWLGMEEIDQKYRGRDELPDAVELRLYDQCVRELKRRGANVQRYEFSLRTYLGAKRCERL